MKNNQLVTGRIVYTSKKAKSTEAVKSLTNQLLSQYKSGSKFSLTALLSQYMSKGLVREVVREALSRKLFTVKDGNFRYFKSSSNTCAAPNVYRTADIIEIASSRLSHKRVQSTLRRVSNTDLINELKSRGL